MSDIETIGVVGYIFSSNLKSVVLIEKKKPKWQAGKCNGVGGKMKTEDGGLPHLAMVRECLEETGVQTDPTDWIEVTIERFPEFTLHVFYAINDSPVEQQPGESEKPHWFPLRQVERAQEELVDGVWNHLEQCLIMMT